VGTSGRARAGTIYVIPGVPRLPNFSTVRRPGRCADGHVVTVQEGRGGQLRVCEPMEYLYETMVIFVPFLMWFPAPSLKSDLIIFILKSEVHGLKCA
jgi:hypothetical protein